MKRLVSVLIIFVCFNANAQYIKMRFDSAHFWNERDMYYDSYTPPNIGYCNNYYQINYVKDTLINNGIYHKVKRTGMGSNQWGKIMPCQSNFGAVIFKYLRQDTVLRKVWLLKSDFSAEQLLYNFSKKNVGDTINNILMDGGVNPNYFMMVQSKDSLLLGDGLYHSRLTYNMCVPGYTGYGNYQAIEGVGYKTGLTFNGGVNVSMFSNHLDCFSRTIPPFTLNIFPNGINPGSCSYMPLNIFEKNQEQINFSLFPNPANNKIEIQTNGESVEQIIIQNILGEEVLKKENSNEVDVSNISNGIYLLILKTQSGWGSKRFVVSH